MARQTQDPGSVRGYGLMPFLAMAAYRCDVAGEPTDSLGP